jgi:hypothetical protein
MLRTVLSSAILVALVSTSGGCGKNPEANTATAPSPSGPQPASSGPMGGQGMMGGQGTMGPLLMGGVMMDGGQGTMGGQGMSGEDVGRDMTRTGHECPIFVVGNDGASVVGIITMNRPRVPAAWRGGRISSPKVRSSLEGQSGMTRARSQGSIASCAIRSPIVQDASRRHPELFPVGPERTWGRWWRSCSGAFAHAFSRCSTR